MIFFSAYSEEQINQSGIKTWALIVSRQMPAHATPTWRQFRSQIASGAQLFDIHSLSGACPHVSLVQIIVWLATWKRSTHRRNLWGDLNAIPIIG